MPKSQINLTILITFIFLLVACNPSSSEEAKPPSLPSPPVQNETEGATVTKAAKIDQPPSTPKAIPTRPESLSTETDEAEEPAPDESEASLEPGQEPAVTPLSVASFLYQLENIDLEAIGQTGYDLIVMDYSADGSDESAFTADQITALKRSPGGEKILLAYMSIGEAETYRFYWDPDWDPDEDGQPDADAPVWLDVVNPDWAGNYKVHYWDPDWQAIIYGSPDSYLDKIIAAGFDGVYLDIIDAYGYYEEQGRDSSGREMVDFVIDLAGYARARQPGFLIFPQNAAELAADFPDYLATVDGIGQEEVYYGYPDDDEPSSPEFLAEVEPNLDLFVEAGKTVLVTAYTTDPAQIDDQYARARARGYVPFATRRDLDQLTVNPNHEPIATAATSSTAQPSEPVADWVPPHTAADWLSNPVRGAVIEIGYGGPDEYNDLPYPSVKSLRQLRKLGAQVVELEFQYVWTLESPYQVDEAQFARVTAALDNIAAAGLYAVASVRNGPGRNAMMPDIANEDVITTLYVDKAAQAAYQDMLRDVVSRFKDRPEIIAWEPIVEPALDFYLTNEEDPPYPQAAALWNELAPQLIAAIREVDPDRPILISPVNWGGPDGFTLFDRFDDNIIYSLHTYEPFAYTHQETPPYTAYPGTFYDEYIDRAALETLLTPVDTFQAQHNVPVVVGEWGGIRWLPGIEQYIADQLSLFESRGWSWFWYAWDDEEWDELGFELHMGPDRDSPAYDPDAPAFRPIVDAWQAAMPEEALAPSIPTFTFASEIRPDGAIRLTDPPPGASDQNPAFSPDGTYLLFTRFENGYNEGPSALYLLDLTNGEVNQLTAAPDSDNVNLPGSSWNAATGRITFASDREDTDEVWTMAADGSDLFRVTDHTTDDYFLEPSFSSNGEWIVFEADPDAPEEQQQGSIWKVRADGTGLTQLTGGSAGGTDDRQPNWSPTGDRILFQRRVPGPSTGSGQDNENWDLYTMAPAGGDVRPVTTTPASDTDASWSPNGQWIVYSSDYSDLPVPKIFVISANGGEPVRVTHGETHYDGAPSWSPDGQWIAFESYPGDEDTPAAIWLVPASATGQTATTLPSGSDHSPSKTRLAKVSHWFYMIDVNLEPEMVEQIAASEYDMVVLDFIPSEENNTDYPMAEVVAQLGNAPQPKLVIAYIDIGQAEEFRTYWQPGWGIGQPEWIIGLDPDGWEGNFPVAYWHDEWRDIWLGEEGYLQAILDTGFDGVYLDWVEAYSDEKVIAFAEEDGADPRQEMIWWVGDIAEFTRAQQPDFIIIGQNAAELAASDEYAGIIDAIAQEQVWFDGAADNDPPGDCPLPRTEAEVETEAYVASLTEPCRAMYEEFPDSTLHVSSEAYLQELTLAQSQGLVIFTVDYALEPENIAWVYQTSRRLGFKPFVSNRALDRYVAPLTETDAAADDAN